MFNNLTLPEFLGLVAGIVGILGYGPYIKDILKHTTRPERAAWLIWALEYAILFVAQFASGATHTLWLIGLQLIGVVAICGLAVKYGVGGINRQSVFLLSCTILALVIWYFSREAASAILLLIAVEAAAVLLTARKVLRQPGSETLSMWACVGVAGAISVAAIESSAAAILYAYPVSLIFMSLIVIGAEFWGRRQIVAQPTAAASSLDA